MSEKFSNHRSFDETDATQMPSVETCPMCGAVRADSTPEGPRHDNLELIHSLATFMVEDWKACCILLLYVAHPNEPINIISRHIILSDAAICEARQRAAKRFPDLAGILGLKTPRARARQAYFAFRRESTGDTPVAPLPQQELPL